MDIEKHLNVLNKKEQSSILKLVDKKLTKISEAGLFYPGLQTYADLHHYKELTPFIKKLKNYIPGKFTVTKCWGNHTDGGYTNWHLHRSDLSIVYYLKNKEAIGTIFRINDTIVSVEGPENSLIIFKSELHSVPLRKIGTPKINRYSLALEVSLKM